MKVLYCTSCGDIRAPDPHGEEWVSCSCGNMAVRWLDPLSGELSVRAKRREFARVIGLNNRMLHASFDQHDNECWRKLHDEATDAHGFIFHKAFRSCWACILRVGETGDVTWDPEVPA